MRERTALTAGLLLLLPALASAQLMLGDTTWVRMVGDPNLQGFGTDVCVDSDSNAIFIGRAPQDMDTDEDIVVAKFDEWGTQLWVRYFDGSEPQDDEDLGQAVACDGSNNVYVAGQVEDTVGDRDMAVVKYDPDGLLLWSWNSGREDEDAAYDVVVTPSGVYACGTAYDTIFELFAFSVVCLDPATGALSWRRDMILDTTYKKDDRRKRDRPLLDRHPDWYDDWWDFENSATTIAIAPDDNLVVTGYGSNDDGFEMWTMKLEPDGDTLWTRTWGRNTGDKDDAAFDLAVATDGNIYICGLGESNQDYDWLTVCFSSAGAAVGNINFDPVGGYDEWATGICLDEASPQGVYVTGFANLKPPDPYIDSCLLTTIKYGHTLAATPWGAGGHQYAYWYNGTYQYPNIAYDVDYAQGQVYVTGRSGVAGADIVVICFDTTNVEPKTSKWNQPRDMPIHPSYEVGSAMSVADSMHIYVCGQRDLRQSHVPVIDSMELMATRWQPCRRDIRVDQVLVPAPVEDSGAHLAPEVTYSNEGNIVTTFTTRLRFLLAGDTVFHDSVLVNSLKPGETTWAVYDSWVATPPGMFEAVAVCSVYRDLDLSNNDLRAPFIVATHDVAPTSIVVPGAVVDSGATLTPQVWFENFGNVPETFPARLTIGAGYTSTVTVTIAGGGTVLQPFAPWTPEARGNVDLECVSQLAGDWVPGNDTLIGSAFVQVVDVAAVEITSPAGSYPLGSIVTPDARWRNYGNVAADFEAWMVLVDPLGNRPYSQFIPVTGLAPGGEVVLNTFPSHTLDAEGAWWAKCSTWLAGDLKPANDTLGRAFTVGGNPDVAVAEILAPTGVLDTNQAVTPQVRLHNGGDIAFMFEAQLVLLAPGGAEQYRERVMVPPVTPGADTVVRFLDWPGSTAPGNWRAVCSLAVADGNPANDTLGADFYLYAPYIWQYGWVEVEPMPTGATARAVKRGGALAAMGGDGLVYATKGYKTGEFYSYDFRGDSWSSLLDVPPGREGKLLEKGARLASNGVDRLWLTKGYNTLGFWTYDPAATTWEQLDDVPLGPSGKKVKGGTDLVYIDIGGTGYVYMLKGYRTEFWRYNTATGLWEARENAPTGIKPKWDKGSWLAYDGENTIYAHKAKYYSDAEHEFWQYDIPADTWGTTRLAGMPLYGLHSGHIRKKKAKDGGCGAWVDGNIWALKGGNSQQFFRYNCESDTWTERDTMPTNGSTNRKRRVKYGADMVLTADALWALKGNKTREFWRYGFWPDETAAAPARSGIAAGPKVLPAGWEFDVRPNPLSGRGTLYYAVPFATTVSARLYDAAGRAVRTLIPVRPVSGRGALRLDTEGLARGVYLLELEAGGASFRTLKLVIE